VDESIGRERRGRSWAGRVGRAAKRIREGQKEGAVDWGRGEGIMWRWAVAGTEGGLSETGESKETHTHVY